MKRDVSVVVHGDEFVVVGDQGDLDWIRKLIQGWFEVKVRGRLGDGVGHDKEVEMIGRKVRWTLEGIEMEADGKYRKDLMGYFGFEEGRTSGVKN